MAALKEKIVKLGIEKDEVTIENDHLESVFANLNAERKRKSRKYQRI